MKTFEILYNIYRNARQAKKIGEKKNQVGERAHRKKRTAHIKASHT